MEKRTQWKACAQALFLLFLFSKCSGWILHVTLLPLAFVLQNMGKRHILFDKSAPKPRCSTVFHPLSRGQGSGLAGPAASHSTMWLWTQCHYYQNKGLAGLQVESIVCTGASVCSCMNLICVHMHWCAFSLSLSCTGLQYKPKITRRILPFVTLIISHFFILL